MDGGGKVPTGRQGAKLSSKPVVDPTRVKEGNAVVLKSRSPFVSSLREADLKSQSRTPQINPPQRHTVSMSVSHTLSSHYGPLQSSRLPSNASVSSDQLSSRGVLSLQSGGHQSHNTSYSSNTTSAFSSYDSTSSTSPLMNQSSVQSQGVSGGNPGGYGHLGVAGTQSVSVGYRPPNSAAGARVQGNFYPHLSEYQPMHSVGAVHPGYSSGSPQSDVSALPHDYHYSSYYQQSAYGVQPSQLQYERPQALNIPQPNPQQTYASQTGAPINYGRNFPIGAHHYGPVQQQPVTGAAYLHPSYYAGSISSTVPHTQHGYQSPTFAPTSATHANVGDYPHYSVSSSNQGYSGQNGYNAGSHPYHPLQSSSSASPYKSMPPNSPFSHHFTSEGYPRPMRTQSPPQPQPTAITAQPQYNSMQHETPTQPQFSSNFLSAFQTPAPQQSQSTHYGVVGSPPQGADEMGASGETSASGEAGACGESGIQNESLLVHPLRKMNLDDKTSSLEHARNRPGACSSMSSSYSQYEDDPSTCTSFLSGGLSNRKEELEDKTGILPKRSVEVFEHPRDCAVAINGTLKLVCKGRIVGSALEEEPLYLWYKDGEPLIGEISSEYVLESIGEGDGGRYFCLVCHPDGDSSVKSEIAVVTIRTSADSRAPVLIQQPEAYVEAVKGEPLVLSIQAEGDPPLNYKWFKGAQELEYCSGSELKIPVVSALDNGQYCCTVSNSYGSVLSDVFLVKVVLHRTLPPPPPPVPHSSPSRKRYSSNPEDNVPSDGALRHLARTVGRHTKNWARLALYLGLLPAEAADSQHYQSTAEQKAYFLLRVWREKKQGSLYALKTILSQAGVVLEEEPSQTSSLESPTTTSTSLPSSSFLPSLSISSQPKDIVVVYGQEAKLEVRSDTLGQMCTYQWYKDGRKLLGRTQKSMIIASTVDSDEGSYTCLVSNADGSVLSHPATITVVSVQPRSLESSQPLKYTAAGITKNNRRREQYASSDPAVYGLTGRGVDDNIVNHYKFQSKPAAISSLSKVGAIQILEQPQSQVAPLGSAVTLTCRASVNGSTSTDELTYVWYMNGLSLLEHTTPEYHIAHLTEEDEGMYSCEVNYLSQSVMSQMATISVAK